ncbi:MAG: chromosome partitioning protein ParB, partial [Bacteroides sp.]|nr:chromosome partitioning protein ParB [Bacteroides sp.]
ASVIAGRDEIPAIVTELSDEEAEEMAITENLQRKDVTPVEEAAAYQRLIESGRHTVQTLAVLFGKNENYIRTRLKFTALIPEIATLLDADEITISVAAEICRYGEDIQREVYEKHLQDEGTYNSWRGLKAADVARRIEQNFTTDLQYYRFDKTECSTCAHNTNNLLLFRDGGCGHCANRTCLAEMNASYLMERAVQIMRNQPEVSLCRDRYTTNETVVERLTASGYEVETLDRYTAFPSCPKEPKAENFNDPERYGEARTRYEQQWADYMEQEEIALERTVEDTKKQILEADITGGKFSADEDTMLYFFLLSSLRKEHFAAVGIAEDKPYITDEDKMGIIGNLTVRGQGSAR